MSRRGIIAAVTVAAAFAIVSFTFPALQAAGNFLEARDPLMNADAAVAISGNNLERVATASRLVREGHAGVLILSGVPRSIEEMRRLAERAGVPAGQILTEDAATSTWENALGSAHLMKAHGLRTAILVTSPYHMRRAIVLFRKAFRREGLVVRAFPAENSMFQAKQWWRRPRDREFVVREYAKLLGVLVGIR